MKCTHRLHMGPPPPQGPGPPPGCPLRQLGHSQSQHGNPPWCPPAPGRGHRELCPTEALVPPPWVSPILGRGGRHTRSLGKWGQSGAEGEQAGDVGGAGPSCLRAPTHREQTNTRHDPRDGIPPCLLTTCWGKGHGSQEQNQADARDGSSDWQESQLLTCLRKKTVVGA